jgi:hypothetical protein
MVLQRQLGITGNPDYEGVPFIDFDRVNSRTPIEDLNLNWRERDLPERVRTKHVHRLHPYLGKFVPQMVEIFLRKYQPEKVCDPFCGSGTTLVEASTLGIDSVGADISEFNCLLSRVKAGQYNLRRLERQVNDALTRFHLELHPTMFKNGLGEEIREAGDYLRQWFAPTALGQLLFYRRLIEDYTYQDVMRVILSRAARSARLTTHFDLDFPKRPQTEPYDCHKHRRECRPTDNAEKFIVRYSLDTLRRIKEFASCREPAQVKVLLGDSRELKFPKADMIITSPPYVGLIDYHEQHRYAYELLGLPSRDEEEIGPAASGTSRAAVARYVDDMTAAFSNAIESLSSGSRVVVIVHDRRELYGEIGKRLGVKLEHKFDRHVNRRTGRRATDFFEDVIVWRT